MTSKPIMYSANRIVDAEFEDERLESFVAKPLIEVVQDRVLELENRQGQEERLWAVPDPYEIRDSHVAFLIEMERRMSDPADGFSSPVSGIGTLGERLGG